MTVRLYWQMATVYVKKDVVNYASDNSMLYYGIDWGIVSIINPGILN